MAPSVPIIGIDPHKRSHTAVVLDDSEELIAQLRVDATSRQVDQLLAWAPAHPDRVWAVENAHGMGHLLAQQLISRGETVVDVPIGDDGDLLQLNGIDGPAVHHQRLGQQPGTPEKSPVPLGHHDTPRSAHDGGPAGKVQQVPRPRSVDGIGVVRVEHIHDQGQQGVGVAAPGRSDRRSRGTGVVRHMRMITSFI